MKHKDKLKKYFWVACIHREDPECQKCAHAQPHQSRLQEDRTACPGECLFRGFHSHCVPVRRDAQE